MDILSFHGEHRWLSNFWPAKVSLDGVVYPSVEHAYQAAKTEPVNRSVFLRCTAAEAKRLGREVPMRADWGGAKVAVMHSLVAQTLRWTDRRGHGRCHGSPCAGH